MQVGDKAVEIQGLIDTGADAVIVNQRVVDKYNLPTVPLPQPLTFRNADDSINKKGTITRRVEGSFNIKGTKLPTNWYVADIGRDDVLFGAPWIRKYNPIINWQTGQIRFKANVIKEQQQIHKYQVEHDPPEGRLWNFPMESPNRELVVSFIHTNQEEEDEDEEILTHNPSRVLQRLYQSQQLRKVNKSTEIAIAAKKDKPTKTLDELLPEFIKDFKPIFEKKAAERFPPSRPWDHAIEFKKDFDWQTKKSWRKIYPLTMTERTELKKFIEENLAKGYIRPSKSPLASPFFFVTKKDGSLRPVQDYRALNEGTVKNAYPLPLISEVIDKLKGAKIFTKLDVRAGYNNVRIKEGDQWKAAFITPEGLFEPTVMFFGLCNAPATFQNMMNDIFHDLLQEGWIVIYMDDILIFSDNIEQHHERTRRVLQRLQESDLFLKAEKCEFDIQEVEFLGSVIKPGVVAMDPVKLKAIVEWETPKTVKQVQAFLGFGNFYRRFIRDYSKIVRPLTTLTKKEKPFLWDQECEVAFNGLKKRFTEEPILRIPDTDKPFQVECDASKIATGAVLRQQGPDGLWHPCAYLSKSFTPAERNYQIYDRELLAIIRALEAWRHFLQGSPHPTEIITDHKNLTYFKTAQKLNRRQARWQLFLSEFNLTIRHQAGKTITQADALSRRSGHDGGEKDNENVVLLTPELFVKATNIELQERIRDSKTRETVVVDNITTKNKDWTEEDGLILFKDRVYVPPEEDLRRDIVKMYHDIPVMGHPGVQKTYELVKREFMWPGMRKFVTQYVRGCATCQTCKVNTHPLKPGLIPIPHSGDTRPFRTITMDYITDLPESDGYNAIQVVVDHDVSKAAVFSPCTKNITAEGAVDILQRDVYSRFGLPAKVISDRGPQFTSKAFRELHRSLGIETALSTAYHPQTDGQTERVNQELDLALRIYCANNPENWAKLLPQFEFAHNQRTHSVTGKSPFELLYGFQPEAIGTVRTNQKHPSTEERLRNLQQARENTIAAHAQAAAAMARRLPTVQFSMKKGDQVLLESKNLRLPYPSRKLAPKRVGPFTITKVLGPVTFELQLPKAWKIHPVFHAALLTPYKTTKEHGPDYVRPPPELSPDEEDNTEEWEVEAILDHRTRRNKKQYLIAWKGWPAAENSWEPEGHLKNAQAILKTYKKRHRLG